MNNAAVIVAGGSGTRMGTVIPKQFLELAGKPILMHTIQCFYDYDPEMLIVVVLHDKMHDEWRLLCKKNNFTIKHQITIGGATRTESVINGLSVIPDTCIVAIHDGVRPFLSLELLTRCYNEAVRYSNAIPVIPVSESLRQLEDGKSKSIDRNLYRLVQTPQCFRADLIKSAYAKSAKNEFTDDASVLEATGESVHLCEGDKLNIKITIPADLQIGEGIFTMLSKK
jgi:2-C-methyl-D-erythritol 4-phosphate cytidylyltransferase